MRSSGLFVLAAVLLFASRAAAQVTVLTHSTVIDGTGAAPQQDVTIVMDNGRIRDVDSQGSIYVAETNFGRRVQKFKIVEGR